MNLLLFFSHGETLSGWQSAGLLDREIAYYRELADRIGAVTLLTYDKKNSNSAAMAETLGPITVLRNDTGLHYWLFGLLAPLRHFRAIRKADLLKTNQFSGAWTGAIAGLIARRPLVVRGGYVRSQFLEYSTEVGWVRKTLAGLLERYSLQSADLVFVATEADREYLIRRYSLARKRIEVVPNPIDVVLFSPGERELEESRLVITVGRLTPQKNLASLIEAIRRVERAKLAVVGAGPEEAGLRRVAEGAAVEFLGAIPNRDVVSQLHRAQIFALSSHYEGSPKALLEAMACAKAIVAANSPGIREVIEDGRSGLLAGPEPADLAEAIDRLLKDPALRYRLGEQARRYVLTNHSQSAVVAREAELLERLVAGRAP